MSQNSQPLSLEEALQHLFSSLTPVTEQQTLPLVESLGRVLARELRAPINLPPFPASAMDGYALRSTDFTQQPTQAFRVVAQSLAGHPTDHHLQPGEAVRVFTGAKVPEGADCVLLQEEAKSLDGDSVTFNAHTPRESFIRQIGHDVKAGQVLATPGTAITPLLCGSLAASGVDQIEVLRKPRVGVFSTGDELVDPGTPAAELQPGQIYDSNRLTVLSLLAQTPCELINLGRLADDEQQVLDALQNGASRCDVLITSGGVSVGDADFVTAAISQLGQLEFWRLNLKPGKPLAFGRIGNCHIFGLPGNPVSTIVTLLLLTKPALLKIAGTDPQPPLRITARLQGSLNHPPGRTEFQRGILSNEGGELRARVTGDQSSNRLSTFHGANCLIEVPGPCGDLSDGERVMVLPFSGLLD